MDEEKKDNIDLFNNPIIENFKKSLSPEQIAEYKKIGEYMYNNNDYQTVDIGSGVKQSNSVDSFNYAVQSLKSGLNPMDLSMEEVVQLNTYYGPKWYEKFDYKASEVPDLNIMFKNTKVQNTQRKKGRRRH